MSKHALLIGGSSGIGLALAKRLLAQSYQVTVISREPKGLPQEANHFQADICNTQIALPEIEEPIDALIYLPGTIDLKPFASLTLDHFKKEFDINFFGAVRAVQTYLPKLKESAKPSLTFVSSVAAKLGMSYHTSIASAKAALEGFCLSLAAELAPTVRVNAVAPSLTQTPLSQPLLDNEKKLEASAKRHPLQRVGTAEDIASAINYLISDEACWITGQILSVDGGFSSLRLI